MKRLFAAIKILPNEHFLSIYYQLLKQFADEPIKWVEPHNLHITLKFFGETDENKIPGINAVISDVTSGFKPFQFGINGVGIFGSKYNPRVIWFGIERNDAIKSMAGDLFVKLDVIGFKNDRQNFIPHLTVGRIKKELNHKRSFQQKIDRFKEEFMQQADVKEILLYESILKPSGPEYKVVERFNLGATFV